MKDGFLHMTNRLFMAISSPLMGIIIDRTGVKRPYVVGLIGYGLSGGAGMLINSYWVLLVSRAFLGIAIALVFTSITVWILNTRVGAGIGAAWFLLLLFTIRHKGKGTR
ncbi:MAG: MFS transporter [Desulfatiglandaceae bacterium]